MLFSASDSPLHLARGTQAHADQVPAERALKSFEGRHPAPLTVTISCQGAPVLSSGRSVTSMGAALPSNLSSRRL